MKITCLNKISKVGTALLTSNYTTEVADAVAADATAVLVRSAAMHEMELSDSVLCVARAGAGVNNIPLDKYAAKGVVVFNTPGANANAVKELVLCGMLLASRDIIGGAKWVEANQADANIAKTAEKAKSAFAGTEIAGKTIAVIGLGAIGILIANACTKLGLNVIGYDPYLSTANALKLSSSVKYTAVLADAVAEADFVTIHVPAMDATKGMVNADLINGMKDGVIILNFSRDTLVNEDAITAALESGKIRKYVTDFATPKAVLMKNAIVLPHLGASTEEAEDNCAAMAVNQTMNYIENGNIINSVNYPNCDAGICKTSGRVAVLHKNVAGVISKISDSFASKNINIAELTSKSKGDYGYAIFDIDSNIKDVSAIAQIDGVIKARIIK